MIVSSADAGYENFFDSVALESIVLTEFHAIRSKETAPVGEYDLSISPSFRLGNDGALLFYRFDATVVPTDESGQEVAELRATYVATFAREGSDAAESEYYHALLNDVVLMAVYPYLRAAFSIMASQLNFPPLTLSLLKRGEMTFMPSNEE